MNEQQKTTIQNLRKAALQHERDQCVVALKQLLPGIEQNDLVQIIQKWIKRFLSDLLLTYPQDSNIRKAVDAADGIRSFDSLSSLANVILVKLEGKTDPDFPGINNFRHELKVFSALQRQDSCYYADFDNAIFTFFVEILTIILSHAWGKQNPDLWHRFFYHKFPRDLSIKALYFWSDPKTIELSKSLWKELADDIESILKAK